MRFGDPRGSGFECWVGYWSLKAPVGDWRFACCICVIGDDMSDWYLEDLMKGGGFNRRIDRS